MSFNSTQSKAVSNWPTDWSKHPEAASLPTRTAGQSIVQKMWGDGGNLSPYSLASLRDAHLGSFWHGYVLHEGITYKSHVPRTSQMTSRLLRHTAAAMCAHNVLCNSYNTAAAMRAHNVLCNSYNSRAKPLQLSLCTFCVVVHSYLVENRIAYFHSSKLVYHGTPNTHRCTTHPW
jgi:hypothetical protein